MFHRATNYKRTFLSILVLFSLSPYSSSEIELESFNRLTSNTGKAGSCESYMITRKAKQTQTQNSLHYYFFLIYFLTSVCVNVFVSTLYDSNETVFLELLIEL